MFTTTVKYAIKACVYLAQVQHEKRLVGIQEICANTQTPTSYTSKVLNQLVKEELVHSERGLHGGFELIPKASDITIKQIIIAMEGSALFTTCCLTSNRCSKTNPCEMHHVFEPVLESLSQSLATINLDNAIYAD